MENNTAVNLSKKIRALESSGFSSDEINEVLKQLGTANAAANNIQYGESLGSWILNFGLPSMVVLGTGALFYLLTGGEDEPAIIAEAGDNDAVNDDINNDSHFLENRTGGVDGEPMPNNVNNQGVNQFYDDSSAKKSSTRSTDRPFRNPASYIPDGDPEKDQNTDNMFGEASQQWLKELLLLSNTMAADIKTIKEEMTNLKSAGKNVRGSTTGSTSSSNGKDSDIESIESSAVSLGPELDTAGYLGNLRRAFRVFLSCRQLADSTVNVTATSSGTSADTQDKSISSGEVADDEALKKGCQALSMYARKVLDNPTQPRYRKISVSNASFKNLVKPLKGHVEVLSAIGFIATVTATPCYEWAWYFELSEEDKSQSAVAKTKRQGKPDAEGVKEILKECIRYLDICTSEGLSSLEKELDKYDIVPPLVDAIKESEGKTTSIATADAADATADATTATADVATAADATKTLLSLKETDTGSDTSSSRENRTKSEVEVGSDGTADGSKISERSSNSAVELNLETASNTAEPSTVCLIKQTSDIQADNIPASNAPAIPVESPSLLFSDIMKFVSKPPG